MKYTIHDLREGKVAVINDGTLEELRRVLELAFPKDAYRTSGTAQFYYTLGYTKEWVGIDIPPDVPTQSVKDFLLPKRGDRVLVTIDNAIWHERIYIITVDGVRNPHLCVCPWDEENFLRKGSFDVSGFPYMKPLPKEVELTMEEIAKLAGVPVELLKIKK